METIQIEKTLELEYDEKTGTMLKSVQCRCGYILNKGDYIPPEKTIGGIIYRCPECGRF